MALKPRNNYVLVEVIPDKLPSEQKTPGGIVIPISISEALSNTHTVGLVESYGPKVDELKIGQHVIFSKHAGNKLKFENKDYVLIEEQQVFASY